MNRPIKFRLWDNADYMSTPFTLKDIQEKKVQFTSDCPVMQFTGLKDKNGKEIYEGDAITGYTSFEDYNDEYEWTNESPCIVSWVEKDCGFYPFILNNRRRCDIMDMEVIGNIHQNPDLLKP